MIEVDDDMILLYQKFEDLKIINKKKDKYFSFDLIFIENNFFSIIR